MKAASFQLASQRHRCSDQLGPQVQPVADTLEFFIYGVTTTDCHEGSVQISIGGRDVKSERETAESLATVSLRTENRGNVPLNQAGLPALASKIGLDNQICIR